MRAIRHLKVWQKFALVGALALAALVPTSGILLKSRLDGFRAIAAERDALQAVADLNALIRLTQQHRGLTAGWLGGDQTLGPAREAKAAEVAQATRTAVRSLAPYDADGALGTQALGRGWETLGGDTAARALAAPESFRRHTALIADQIHLLARVADRSGLILDADPAGFHLIAASTEAVPMITEMLGQNRALGAAALNRKAATSADRANLASNLTVVEQHAWSMNRHLDAAREADAAQVASLTALRAAAAGATEQAIRLVRQKVIEPEQLSEAAAAYFAAMTGFIDMQFRLGDAVFAQMRESLEARHAAERNALIGTLALVLGAVGAIGATIASIARSTSRNVAAALAATDALARGDLRFKADIDAQDEIGQIARGIGEATGALAGIVSQIRMAGESVGTASAQIASGNSDLSARTESTASSLQEAAASMEQLTATVRTSARTAHEATRLATEASDIATEGGRVIGGVTSTMDEIAASSSRINDIIGVIDAIAFQTNILALNAAVEAARAGDQGRGFAVVAGEVRSLARRSADAAREIKSLISESTATVQSGTVRVGEAGRAIAAIVDQAAKVRELIAEIGRAADEQSAGIGQVNAAVSHLDQATQQNAALVEESAAAAESLRTQAHRLVGTIGRFRVEPAA